jgi:hypothetical protein
VSETAEKPVAAPVVRLAKHLHVVWRGDHKGLLIDGEWFGFATVDGYHVAVTREPTMPGVTLTIAAESVTVDYDPFPSKGDSDV